MRRTKALLLAAVFVASCSTPKGSDARRYLPTSGPLPDVQGTSLSGGSVTPDQYRGKVVLLNFWNQDCPPCREEMPVLETAWETLRTQGLYVIGVVYVGGGWPNDPEAARTFLSREGITYPTIVDTGSRWANSIGIVGIPTTVVVDRSGVIRYRLLGRVHPADAEDLLRRLTPSS